MQCFHNSFHLQQNHKLNFFVFFILRAFQTASGQKTTIQLLTATQAMHISRKSELKKKSKPQKIEIPR